jgi:hypothetical protein
MLPKVGTLLTWERQQNSAVRQHPKSQTATAQHLKKPESFRLLALVPGLGPDYSRLVCPAWFADTKAAHHEKKATAPRCWWP